MLCGMCFFFKFYVTVIDEKQCYVNLLPDVKTGSVILMTPNPPPLLCLLQVKTSFTFNYANCINMATWFNFIDPWFKFKFPLFATHYHTQQTQP